MRIALDITPLFQDQPTGVAYYCASVINALVLFEVEHEYILFGICPRGMREKVALQLRQMAPQALQKILYVPQKTQAPLLNTMQTIPFNLIDRFIDQVDIFHQFDAYSFVTHFLSTATVFDLSALKFPETHATKNVSIQVKRLTAIRSRCQHFFTISATIKGELTHDWHLPNDFVTVAYPPIDNRQALTDSCVDCACLKKKPGIFFTVQKNKFLLNVATREPRKNLGTLIEAFEQLDASQKHTHPLVIVGAKGWGSDVVQGTRENIWVSEYVCDSCLEFLYHRAFAFIFVSTYEGFGMPIAEAMKAGVPVICSDLPVFREITGNAAMHINARSTAALSKAMAEVFAMSDFERASMIKKGLYQTNIFSAKTCASVMVNTWATLVQSGHENSRF